jgi:bifunctional DNA-binding transcriptional regulator/antitoxin component of YhaV-PrlF toxin-antitoxin module
MDVAAKLSSKVQIRVLKAVRDVLEREEGDDVLFRVEGQRAIMSKTPQLLDLAGSIAVPEDKRSAT